MYYFAGRPFFFCAVQHAVTHQKWKQTSYSHTAGEWITLALVLTEQKYLPPSPADKISGSVYWLAFIRFPFFHQLFQFAVSLHWVLQVRFSCFMVPGCILTCRSEHTYSICTALRFVWVRRLEWHTKWNTTNNKFGSNFYAVGSIF